MLISVAAHVKVFVILQYISDTCCYCYQEQGLPRALGIGPAITVLVSVIARSPDLSGRRGDLGGEALRLPRPDCIGTRNDTEDITQCHTMKVLPCPILWNGSELRFMISHL